MNNNLTPKEYFDILKDKKNTITDKELVKIYDNCIKLMKKYITTGQVKGAKKLMFHLDTIEKERDIVSTGVDTFVYKDDIEYYIDNVANDVVKIIELENYEREIPDEVVEVVDEVGNKFDQLYVLFTDYTGKVEREVEKERRERDPILFGTFQDKTTKSIVDRFYFLGDWEDEYCDLTLDKMVNEMKEVGKEIEIKVSTPASLDELKEQLSRLEKSSNNNLRLAVKTDSKQKSLFSKVRSIFK